MNAFALLVGIALAGIAVQAAVSLRKTGRLELSRFWYLALGLVLMIPTMGYPLDLPLTLAWGLGLYLVVRFAMSRPSKARVVNAA